MAMTPRERIVRALEYARARGSSIPAAGKPDHGQSPEVCAACIEDGFWSMMIDGSSLPREENVGLTREAVDHARRFGASV